MKQHRLRRASRTVALLFVLAVPAAAQTSLDILEKDLDEVKQERQDASNQTYTNLLGSLETASSSPDAAIQLYQQAGGTMPDPTKVTTHYEHETPTEKAARVSQDQAILGAFGSMLQLHCGLMRIAAMFATNPDAPTLHDEWTAWLKNAAQIYPQLSGANDVRNLSMRDSPISNYLIFHGWGDKEQGTWSVHEVPKFYRDTILEPLRHPAVAAALPAWDAYIALRGANQPDTDKWNNEELPELQFDRTADDFAVAPTQDKLESLVALIKAHPTHSKMDEWIARTHDMMKSYRASHGGASSSTASAPTQ